MDVPAIVSFSSSFGNVEQNADIPAPPGCVGVRGFQGFRPGQDSAFGRADHAEIPVPRRGFDEGLQSFLPEQVSTASLEQTVHIPVPHGGRHDFLQRILQIRRTREIKGFFRTFPRYKKSAKIPRTQQCESAPGVEFVASMSLAGVLACFMGNDMGCDNFFWLFLAEWFGLGVALPGLPSCSVIQNLSPVWTEHGVVYTRHSTDASGKMSLSVWLARAVCTWKHGAFFRYGPLAVIVAVFGCCLWCTIGFSGARGAMLGSPVDTCSASASRGSLTNFTHFLCCGGLVSCSIITVLTQNGEVCSADAAVCSLFGAAHTLKSGHYFYDNPWLAVVVTILRIFATFLQHISGSSLELSTRASAQALVHV